MIKKHELQIGDIIKTRSGRLYVLESHIKQTMNSIIDENQLFFSRGIGYIAFTSYTEDLQGLINNTPPSWQKQFKVVRVYRPFRKCLKPYLSENILESVKTSMDITFGYSGCEFFIPLKCYV